MKSKEGSPDGRLLLGIDTCGPSGTVALGRMAAAKVEVLEQIELEGKRYSAVLVTAVGELLAHAGIRLSDLRALVVVNGPGSFTGVRVGLSTVKGLAEAAGIAVAAVSRLEVLAWKAGTEGAALDAHRHEVFLRLGAAEGGAREFLAGAEELRGIGFDGMRIAVCDDETAMLMGDAMPGAELIRSGAPTAGDALGICAGRVEAGEFADLALLDGHYLRRSDAEIFGEAASGRADAERG